MKTWQSWWKGNEWFIADGQSHAPFALCWVCCCLDGVSACTESIPHSWLDLPASHTLCEAPQTGSHHPGEATTGTETSRQWFLARGWLCLCPWPPLQELPQLLLGQVEDAFLFTGIQVHGDIFPHKQKVTNVMLSPNSVWFCLVVIDCHEHNVLWRNLTEIGAVLTTHM